MERWEVSLETRFVSLTGFFSYPDFIRLPGHAFSGAGYDSHTRSKPAATLAVLESRLKTLEPRSQELNLNSDSETIRLAMLNSHHAWQSMWFDGQVTWYSAAGDAPQVSHNQVWVERLTGQFRSLVGPQDGDPLTLQIADGTNLVSMDLATGSSQASTLPPGANIPDWDAPQGVTDMITAHPLAGSMEASVRDMIFPTALAQRGGTYTPVTVEKVAGQTALVVDWGEDGARQDRFWVDARTGVVLRWQSFDKAQDEQLVSDMLTRTIVYNPVLRPSLFNLNVSEKPRFALDPSGEAGVAEVVPTTPYKPGCRRTVLRHRPQPGGPPAGAAARQLCHRRRPLPQT